MKITAIGHAAILIETAGITILSDPWWRGPCFGAQWWIYPPPALGAIDCAQIDYIYISHGHHDHYHPGTLATLPKTAKILVSKEIKLAGAIRELGFEVIEISSNEEMVLGDSAVRVRIIQTHGDDTLMALSDGHEVCLNLNDALHSASRTVQDVFVARLKNLYPKIDYVFCGYGTASHFPNCYLIPEKAPAATAIRRQRHFNSQWSRLIAELNPQFGFPFAADVAFFDNALLWMNEPTHNSARPTHTFHATYPASAVKTVDIAPGFLIDSGEIVNDARRQPLVDANLRIECADQIARANRLGAVEPAAIDEAVQLLERNLAIARSYLAECEQDYRFLISFRNSIAGIAIEKRSASITITRVDDAAAGYDDYDVVYDTRLHYLKWALSRPFGDEILFVGSGGVFAYRSRADAERNLHRELVVLLKACKVAPQSRYGNDAKWLFKGKQVIKSVIGKKPEDLYDLKTWTVFGAEPAGLAAPRSY